MLANALHIYRQIFAPYKARVGWILLMSLGSQVCLLISLILPWQILYVLSTGHSRMDSMLSTPMPAMLQLLWLSLVIAVSFGLYVWLKHQSKVGIEDLADKVVYNLDKTKLMVNHQAIAHFTMGVIIRSLAAIVNWLVFTTIVAFIYPKMAFAILLYMLILAMSIQYSLRQSPQLADYQKLQDRLQQNSLLLTNLGIAVGFVVIVYDYMQQSLPSLLLTFIAVLISRQALLAYVNVALGLLGIKKRINNINLLFLSKEQQLRLSSQNDFEQQFYQQHLKDWLPSWVRARYHTIKARHPKIMERDHNATSSVKTATALQDNAHTNPYQTGLTIECVECKLFSKATIAYVVIRITERLNATEPPINYYLLLKCYHPTKASFAQHEIDFLTVFGQPKEAGCALDKLTLNQATSKNIVPLAHVITAKPKLSIAGLFGKNYVDYTNGEDDEKDYPLISVSKEESNRKGQSCAESISLLAENKGHQRHHSLALIPTLIESGELTQGRYLLMDCHPDAVGQTLTQRRLYYNPIREQIYNLPVPSQLTEKFQRTHVDLGQRMRALDWSRLDYLHQDERDELRVDEMRAQWQALIAQVERLPKTLTVDNMTTLRLAICADKPIVYCWQGWVVDSLGAYWQISGRLEQEVTAVVAKLIEQRHAALITYINQYGERQLIGATILAARVHNFCRNLQQKHNIDALNSLKAIFKTIQEYQLELFDTHSQADQLGDGKNS